MNESVTVIITCYNLEKYIGAAIDSVLSQDYRGPMQILVVDDCSTDSSAQIVRKYPGVEYRRTSENAGVLLATVCGIENARAPLICFLDGDDIWLPNKVSVIASKFASDPNLALVTHDLLYINEVGASVARESVPEKTLSSVQKGDSAEVIRRGILMHLDYVWLGSAYSIRRTLIDLEGFCSFVGTLPRARDTYQDWPLAFWIASQPAIRLDYVNQKLFKYRLHGANYSGDSTSLEKAVRNITRAKNTVEAIEKIGIQFDCDCLTRQAIARKLAFYSYLLDLYSGRKGRATAGFFRNLRYLKMRNWMKEWVRFLAIQVFGGGLFVAMTGRLRARI